MLKRKNLLNYFLGEKQKLIYRNNIFERLETNSIFGYIYTYIYISRTLQSIHPTANLSHVINQQSKSALLRLTFPVRDTGGSFVKNWPPNKLDQA